MTLLSKNLAITLIVETVSWHIRIPGAVTHLKGMVKRSGGEFFVNRYFMSLQPLGERQNNPTENEPKCNDYPNVIQKKLHHNIHLRPSYTTILDFLNRVVDLSYRLFFDKYIDQLSNIEFSLYGSSQLKGFHP